MKKKLIFYIGHFLHWVVLYGAFVMKLDGAMYLLLFFAWFSALISFVLFTDQAIQIGAKEGAIPGRRILSSVQAGVTLILLVWNGCFFTGIAWSFSMLAASFYWSQVKKLRANL